MDKIANLFICNVSRETKLHVEGAKNIVDIMGIEPRLLLAAALINFLLFVVLLVISISNGVKLKKLKSKYEKFMGGEEDLDMEELLERCIERVNKVSAKSREIENKINNIERVLLHCVQKVGLVRYNAFENVGSDLSFSIALLDDNDNGVVISGLYSRDSSFTYAKPIVDGKSKYALSAEELQAIDIAKRTYSERLYTD